MRTLGWMLAGLLAAGPAFAADHRLEIDWSEEYETATKRAKSSAIAGLAGLGVAGMGGLVFAVRGGCDAEGDLCQGPYLPDGLVFAGAFTANLAALGMSPAAIRASRALREQGGEASSAAAYTSYFLLVGSAASAPFWMGFKRPAEWAPKMPVIRDPLLLGVNAGLLAGVYTLGLAQIAINKRNLGRLGSAALQLDVQPWAPRGGGAGLRVGARF